MTTNIAAKNQKSIWDRTCRAGAVLFLLSVLGGAALWLAGSLHFGREPGEHREAEGVGHEGHGHGEGAGKEGAEHAGPDNLDPSEIEKRECEHKMRQFECQECRYELGVVKVDPSVTDALAKTATVREGRLPKVIRLTGEVQFDQTGVVDVVPICPGRVVKVNARLGDRVQQGQVLAEVHSVEFGEAKAAFLETKTTREQAELARDREEQLVAKQASSRAELEAAERELKMATARLAATEQRLHLLGMNAESIAAIDRAHDKAGFARLEIRAPRPGVVTAQNITDGQYVETTQSIFTVADNGSLWVWCDLYERDLAALHEFMDKGNKPAAAIKVAAFPEPFAGVLDLLGSAVDETSRTVKVRVTAKDGQGRLKPGMFARVEIELPEDGKAALAPRGALLVDEGRQFVFVHWRDDLWLRRNVKTGRVHGDMVEVLEGLNPGARVVTAGGFLFKSDVLRAKMGAGCAD